MNKQKHLGLTLNSCLSFGKHLNEKVIKANKNLGIIKYLSRFLPLNTLDQMYKALVRSNIIYHIPSTQNQFGEILNILMEKAARIQYQAALAITGDGKDLIDQISMMNWGGNLYPIADGVGEFYRFIKLCIMDVVILKINFPFLENTCTVKTTLILFMEWDVNQIDT